MLIEIVRCDMCKKVLSDPDAGIRIPYLRVEDLLKATPERGENGGWFWEFNRGPKSGPLDFCNGECLEKSFTFTRPRIEGDRSFRPLDPNIRLCAERDRK